MGVPPFRQLTEEGSLHDLNRGMVAMSLNEPALSGGRCVVEGPLTVRGWAHARGGIDSVAVVLDDRRYEALRPVVRTDLLDYYGADAAREGGFVLRFDPSECPPGDHRLTVVAIGRDGDAVGIEGRIACGLDPLDDAEPAPVASVDWMDERTVPHRRDEAGGFPEGSDGLVLMWESRARVAEADAAASRVEAGLASAQQEAAIRMLRAAEARVSELEAKLADLKRS